MFLEKVALLRRRQGFTVIALSALTVILLAVGVGAGVASANSSSRHAPRAAGIIVYSQVINPASSWSGTGVTRLASLSLPAGTFLIDSSMNVEGPGVTCDLDLTVGTQTSVLDSASAGESLYHIPFMSVGSLSSPGTVAIDCSSHFGGGQASMVKLIATEVSKSHVQT